MSQTQTDQHEPRRAGAAHGAAHDGEGRHDGHPPYLAHHFETPKQQLESAKLGMWLFLATELLMFGGLFCAYSVWRANNFEVFDIGHVYLSTGWGALNTLVLIASSFTMAWAVRAIMLNQQRLCFVLLALTFGGGVIFMGVKAVEYGGKFTHGMGPGALYSAHEHRAEELGAPPGVDPAAPAGPTVAPAPAEDAPLGEEPLDPDAAELGRTLLPDAGRAPADVIRPDDPGGAEPAAGDGSYYKHSAEELLAARSFFGIYFAMTGLHGLHVLVGMGLIAWIMFRVKRAEFGPEYNTPVDLVGLYWHLVDLIWIFLFPLLYLIH